MSEHTPIQRMNEFEKLIEKSISNGRFTDFDASKYGYLRTVFIEALAESDILRNKLVDAEVKIVAMCAENKSIEDERDILCKQLEIAVEALRAINLVRCEGKCGTWNIYAQRGLTEIEKVQTSKSLIDR